MKNHSARKKIDKYSYIRPITAIILSLLFHFILLSLIDNKKPEMKDPADFKITYKISQKQPTKEKTYQSYIKKNIKQAAMPSPASVKLQKAHVKTTKPQTSINNEKHSFQPKSKSNASKAKKTAEKIIETEKSKDTKEKKSEVIEDETADSSEEMLSSENEEILDDNEDSENKNEVQDALISGPADLSDSANQKEMKLEDGNEMIIMSLSAKELTSDEILSENKELSEEDKKKSIPLLYDFSIGADGLPENINITKKSGNEKLDTTIKELIALMKFEVSSESAKYYLPVIIIIRNDHDKISGKI